MPALPLCCISVWYIDNLIPVYARVPIARVARMPPLARLMRDVIYFGVTRRRYQSPKHHLLRASVTGTTENRDRLCCSDHKSEVLDARTEGSATCDHLK